MSVMISKGKLCSICAQIPCSSTCRFSDYLGAENAGLHALLLRRTGAEGDREREDAKVDLRTIQSLNVVNDLYGVVAWVERMNTRK
jgi:hypothetical protein